MKEEKVDFWQAKCFVKKKMSGEWQCMEKRLGLLVVGIQNNWKPLQCELLNAEYKMDRYGNK